MGFNVTDKNYVFPWINDLPMNRHIAMDITDVISVYNFVATRTFMDDLNFLFTTPNEWIVSIRAYPCDVTKLFNYSSTEKSEWKIGLIENTGVTGYQIITPKPHIDMGSYEIPHTFNSFLDYAPYTKITIYLPYIGFAILPTDEVMGKTLNIKYSIDVNNGVVTAYIIANDVLILTTQGKIGIDIGLGSTNTNEVTKNLLFTGVGAIGGVVASGVGSMMTPLHTNAKGKTIETASSRGVSLATQGVGTLINTSIQMLESKQQHVTKGNVGDGYNSLSAPQNCYLIIEKPRVVEVEDYNKLIGVPCGATLVLGDLTGYTQVDSIHLEGFDTATDNELMIIEDELKKGVIL